MIIHLLELFQLQLHHLFQTHHTFPHNHEILFGLLMEKAFMK